MELDVELRRELTALDAREIQRKLDACVESARAAWPALSVSREAFLKHIARKVATPLGEAIDQLHAGDLYLAYAIGTGDPDAVAAVEAQHLPTIDAALGYLEIPRTTAEEVKQLVRHRLFVPRADRSPEILDYGGRGELRRWIRAMAIRIALKHLRDQKRHVQLDDEFLASLPLPADNVEVAYLRARYGAAFKVAFSDAMSSVSARDRTLLRRRFIDGLSLDELATLEGVHRSTVARRLVKMQNRLRSRTRRLLAKQLKVGKTELQSILRLVKSHVQLTLEHVLRK